MSASTPNTRKAVSYQAVHHLSTTARTKFKAQEVHAAKVRQIELEYNLIQASTSVETVSYLPSTTPDRHSTVASVQTEARMNTTTNTSQPEHPYHRTSLRDPDEYLKVFARVSELRANLYCICRRPEYGAMVECCNEDECAIGWYHAACVGMTVLPGLRDDWFCERCRERQIGRLAIPGEPSKPIPLVLFAPNWKPRADAISSTAEALPASTQDTKTPKAWTKVEHEAMQALVRTVSADGEKTGRKMSEEVARQLADRCGFERRSGESVRAHWNRAEAANGIGEGVVGAGVAGVSEKLRGKMRAGEEDEEYERDSDEEMVEEDEDNDEMAEEGE